MLCIDNICPPLFLCLPSLYLRYLQSPFCILIVSLLLSGHLFVCFHIWEKTCVAFLSVSDLFCLMWFPPVPFIFLQKTGFHFLWMNNIPLCISITFSLSVHPADCKPQLILCLSCCELSCDKHKHASIPLVCRFHVFWIYTRRGTYPNYMVVLFLVEVFKRLYFKIESYSWCRITNTCQQA